MAERVTMRDIADRLGVSTVTVSRALTDREGVEPELRETVKRTAKEMGYRYRIGQRTGRRAQSFRICVLVAKYFMNEGQTSFYGKMYQWVYRELTHYGYQVELVMLEEDVLDRCELPEVLGEQADRRPDGILVMGELPEVYLWALKETGIPEVYLDFYHRGTDMPAVLTDNMYGGYLVTDYLIRQGCRKLAYVGSILATTSILDRYLGYYRALVVHGLKSGEDCIIPDRGKDGLFLELELPLEMPDGFVCNCDEVASRLERKLHQMGLRVPEDVKIAGFDGHLEEAVGTKQKETSGQSAGYSSFPTIRVDMEEMASTAVEMLIRLMKGERGISGRKVIMGTLLTGEDARSDNR